MLKDANGNVAGALSTAPALGFWLADYTLQLVGVLLIVLRGTLPDAISILLGVPLLLGGTLLLFIGLERYLGQERKPWINIRLLVGFVLVPRQLEKSLARHTIPPVPRYSDR